MLSGIDGVNKKNLARWRSRKFVKRTNVRMNLKPLQKFIIFLVFFLWQNSHLMEPTKAFLIRTDGGKFQESELAPSPPMLFDEVVLMTVSFGSLVMNKWISVLTKLISFNFVNLKSDATEKNASTKRVAWQIKIYFGLKVHCSELFWKPSLIITDLDSHRNLSGFSSRFFRG